MKTWLITRHSGAIEWFKHTGQHFDHHQAHITMDNIRPNDRVYGSLPIHLVEEICSRGAEYWHLSLDLPAHLRGQELTAEQLNQINARIERFIVNKQ